MDNFKLTTYDGYEVEWGVNRFPDGQVQVWISNSTMVHAGRLSLKCRLTSPEDMHILDQLTILIKDLPVTILYLYGSRCDKDTQGDRTVYNQHDYLCRYFTEQDSVLMPHGILPYGVQEIIPPDPGIDNYDVIVFPDESAKRRFGKYISDSKPTVTCSKARDQITGNIMEYRVPLSEGVKLIGKRVLVVDDICDGGATFKMIADEIRSVVSSMDLYVVHGIFSKGVPELFTYGYQNIYTTNSYQNWPTKTIELCKNHKLTVFDVWK